VCLSADPNLLSAEQADWLSTLFDVGGVIGGYCSILFLMVQLLILHGLHYRMVCKGHIFTFFVGQEPFAKIKNHCPCAKQMNLISIPAYLELSI